MATAMATRRTQLSKQRMAMPPNPNPDPSASLSGEGMLIAMSSSSELAAFATTGRTGRRNAVVAGLIKEPYNTGTGDLPQQMERLSTSDAGPSTSAGGAGEPEAIDDGGNSNTGADGAASSGSTEVSR